MRERPRLDVPVLDVPVLDNNYFTNCRKVIISSTLISLAIMSAIACKVSPEFLIATYTSNTKYSKFCNKPDRQHSEHYVDDC